jgi:hypothetical protein
LSPCRTSICQSAVMLLKIVALVTKIPRNSHNIPIAIHSYNG